LHGKRGGEALDLKCQGEPRLLEAILIFDWQFASAPMFLVLLIVLIVTQPLVPPPIWRAILTLACGLAIVAAIPVVEITQGIPWTPIWRIKPVSDRPSQGIHLAIAAIVEFAGIALAILGTFDIGCALARRSSLPPA